MNRALAHRSAFEGVSDVKHFLEFVAEGCRRASVELLAFTVMVNHFHLLVHSVSGQLSMAMQFAESRYTQWFNAARGRDGALFRGRFRARPLQDHFDQLGVLSYIDFNPVEAGLVEHPCDYPFGSASHYAQPAGPPWLARTWVEHVIGRAVPGQAYDPESYRRWCTRGTRGARWVARRRCEGSKPVQAALETLIGAPGSRLREWLRANAVLADGTKQFECVVDPGSVRDAVAQLSSRSERIDARPADSALLELGLVRSTCGLTLEEAARELGLSRAAVVKRFATYRDRLGDDDGFADAAASALGDSLVMAHGNERV